MTVTRGRGAKAKCDVLFSKIVRFRGSCENCDGTDYLQTAHIISRRYVWVRTLEANAFCLCARCHHYFTDQPVEFAAFVEKEIGTDEYSRIRELALRREKFDWDAELERLQARWKAMQ